jgi:hypothetical protein
MVEAIPRPEEFFGFKPGEDRKLARWDRIVEYFRALDGASDRIRVVELGESTEGNPFILAYISSEENLGRLEEYREMSWNIGHPEWLTDEEVEETIREGRAVVAMTMSIHASEVGGTQVSSELAHALITGEDELTRRIRENVVFLLFPCANPDGQVMTVDWYRKWLGTEYEGCGLPWLYHKYTGHDNNRDALTLTQAETRMMSRVILKEWFPQAYVDQHQMGFYGSRFFIPPNANPLNEVADPMVWVEQKHYGAQMAIRMEAEGLRGVEQAAVFPADFMPGFSLVFPWFGICGMFTESASAKFATPVYVHYHQLQANPRGRPEYRAHVNLPNPWRGGWWSLSDILRGQRAAAMAALEVAANNREMILRNMHGKASRAITKGDTEPPYAFVVPPDQGDPATAARFLRTLEEMGVEVSRATEPFTADGATYPAGSYVLLMNQTARAFLVSLLSRTFYRDNVWVRTKDGTPMMNYDFATMTQAEFKGVRVVEAAEELVGEFEEVDAVELPEGGVDYESEHGHALDPRLNDGFRAVNALLRRNVKVYRALEEVETHDDILPPGAFYVPPQKGKAKALREVAEEAHVALHALESEPVFETREVRPLRVAVYQRYWGGNTDEGWTRWLLEQYGFEYSTVRDAEVKEGLKDRFDVLILPSDAAPMITGEKMEEYFEKRFKGMFTLPVYPPEYRSGIGEEGVAKLREFAEAGGTILALNEASDAAVEMLKLPLLNVVKDLDAKEFHCPGSTIWTDVDAGHPLAYGMPERALILLRGKLAFAVKPGHSNEDYRVVVSYPEERMMQSGWLIGEEKLARKAALIEARVKEGRVVLYGFAPQARAMTDATFKLFFNALLG